MSPASRGFFRNLWRLPPIEDVKIEHYDPDKNPFVRIDAVLVHGYISHTFLVAIVTPSKHQLHQFENKLWVTNHPLDSAIRPLHHSSQAILVLQNPALSQFSHRLGRAIIYPFIAGVARDFFSRARLPMLPINYAIEIAPFIGHALRPFDFRVFHNI